MLVKACLNGGRTRAEHPAVPLTPEEIAADAARAVAAGASALHVHPRGADGRETLDPAACAAVVRALRAACPGVPVGLTTGQWIEGSVAARLEAVAAWEHLPDFVSVNVYEDGVVELCSLLSERGIALEAGLATVTDVERMPDVAWLRALVEVEEPEPADAVSAAAAISRALEGAGVAAPQLHHGQGIATWAVLEEAMKGGRDVRVGLEDTLVLPDGRTASSNAELVAAAVALARG